MEAKPAGFFTRRPWLMVVMVFVVLTVIWAVVVTIAVKNRPEKIRVQETAKP